MLNRLMATGAAIAALSGAAAAQAQEVFLNCSSDGVAPGSIYAFSESQQAVYEYKANTGQLVRLCGDAFIDTRVRPYAQGRVSDSRCVVTGAYIAAVYLETSSDIHRSPVYRWSSVVYISRNTGVFGYISDYYAPNLGNVFGPDLHDVNDLLSRAQGVQHNATCRPISDPRSATPLF